MKRIAAALAVVTVLCATAVYAQPPPEPPIWSEELKAELPKGMNATKYKGWIRVVYAAGKNLISLHGHKYGMVEGQRIPVAIFQCTMFRLGHDYAVKKGWDGIAKMAKKGLEDWKCDENDPNGPGAVVAAMIRDEEAAFIARHGFKARVQEEMPDAQVIEVSGKAATFTATVGTGAAILLIIGSLITG